MVESWCELNLRKASILSHLFHFFEPSDILRVIAVVELVELLLEVCQLVLVHLLLDLGVLPKLL